MMPDSQPISTAPMDGTEVLPMDGTEVLLPLVGDVRAYWCSDLKRWVLSKPLHIESLINPPCWKPTRESAANDRSVCEADDE